MSRSWRWLRLACALLLLCLSVVGCSGGADESEDQGSEQASSQEATAPETDSGPEAPGAPGAGGGSGEEENTGGARGAPITMPAFSREGRPLGGPDGVLEEMKGELAEKCAEALGREGLCVDVGTEPSGVDPATCYYTGQTRPAAGEVIHEDDQVVFVCNSRPNPEETPAPEATPEP